MRDMGETHNKTSDIESKHSRRAKRDTSVTPCRLTPSEIESLRKESKAAMKQLMADQPKG